MSVLIAGLLLAFIVGADGVQTKVTAEEISDEHQRIRDYAKTNALSAIGLTEDGRWEGKRSSDGHRSYIDFQIEDRILKEMQRRQARMNQKRIGQPVLRPA